MHMAVPNLTISAESVCFVIVKARQYDVQDVATDEDAASNATDDGMTGVLEERADDPTRREIVSFIRALSQDEQVDLVTLMRLGRGDATLEDWDDLRAEADQAAQQSRRQLPSWRTVAGRLPRGRAFAVGHILRGIRDRSFVGRPRRLGFAQQDRRRGHRRLRLGNALLGKVSMARVVLRSSLALDDGARDGCRIGQQAGLLCRRLLHFVLRRQLPVRCGPIALTAKEQAMPKVGDKVPSATLHMMGPQGPRPITTEELFAPGKKVVAFALPGAFTPT